MIYYQCIAVLLWFSATQGLRNVPQYAKDFSEHCKRRAALPSVFLSRRVMDADAAVLHFSRLEIPYNCFSTVRTEAGQSIIMVIEISSADLDQEFCKDGYQIGVFEYAETFGGYWGPIPDAVLQQDPEDPVYTKQYTLGTRPPPTTTETTELTTRVTRVKSSTAHIPTPSVQDFITVDVPLVNLSASLVPIEVQDQKPFDVDEFFDTFYDVMPRPGNSYRTSILPLVQIAVKKQDSLRDGQGEPRYELDYEVGPFTPDHRKQYSPPATQAKYEVEKKKTPFNFIDDIMKSLNESGDLTTQNQSTDSDVLAIFNTPDNNYHNLSVYLAPYSTNTFMPISEFLFNFTKNTYETRKRGVTETILVNTNVLNNKSQHDLRSTSVLAYTTAPYKIQQNTEQPKTSFKEEFVTKEKISMATSETDIITFPSSARAGNSTKLIIKASSNPAVKTSVHEYQEKSSTLAAMQLLADDRLLPIITTERSLSGTLVDHESWENVVQSAPVMAGLLNQHSPELNSSSNFKLSNDMAAQNKRRIRRKRHISAIMVDEARPHSRATTTQAPPQPSIFNAIDVLEFARLIELPDDQMNNHVTIKMNPETSPQLFNMCGANNGSKTRFLVVFNSSRIILSINNFSLPHVMVALTTARPLALMEQQCPENFVECQVEGTRLCIDNTNACDGIPNCGSAYAYDEDRVLCGVIDRQGTRVYLAAASCLAVVVTMLYVIHYWLRICVPKVAEAFFIYYDSADNELYLDSIMRSPMDGDGEQYMYNSALFDEENMLYYSNTESRKSTNMFKRVFSLFPKINLFKRRRSSKKLSVDEQRVGRSLSTVAPGNNSLTESDLRTMMSAARDQEVQTGESLEMAYLKVINSIKPGASDKRLTKQRLPSIHHIAIRDMFKDKTPSSLDDTSLDVSGPSGGEVDLTPQPGVEEKEIHSTFYTPGTSTNANLEKFKSPGTAKARQSKDTAHAKKILRFNENTTCIPRKDNDDDDALEMQELSTGKLSHKKTEAKNSDHGSDFRKFFRKKKDHN